MRKIPRLLLLVALIMAAIPAIAAKIDTPALIGDNMVLKRNCEARIWGWAGAGERMAITASWCSGDTIWADCDHNSRFEAAIKTPEAGGPYTIKIKGDNDEKVIENVMIGEVWLCSGQSNMQMSLAITYGTKVDYHDEFSKIDNPNIRTFVTPRIGASSPQNDCKGSWDELSSETISDVSLAAYFFAEKLERELEIPIGIVVSAWGGTNAEVWMADECRTNSDVDKSAAYMEPQRWKPITTGSLYNSMISPLVPFSFSGTIWYQGESNIPCYRYYDSVMRTLIDSWRGDFGSEIPFYYVQIAPFAYGEASTKGRSAYLREQQSITASHPNCAMVVVNDLVDDVKNIHPKNKRDVGGRLADVALNHNYGRDDIDCSYPEIESVKRDDAKLVLKIKGCSGITLINGENSGFMIADEMGNFVEAKAKVTGNNTITLNAKGVKEPIYVRYLFDDISLCTVKGTNGLPMIPYRNDKF